MSIYEFTVTREDGKEYALSTYQGHVMLIVNTATKCGFTPQFEGLENLYQTYKDQGFVVLGFPSNQFKQEVATSEEAALFCQKEYGVTFPMHQLSTLNGKEALPLFDYLKQAAPGVLGSTIKWNFTKFLVDAQGRVIKRFAPKTTPEELASEIEQLLKITK